MYSLLKTKGRKRSDELARTEAYFLISPAGLSLLRAMKPVIEKYASGILLDAGAGRMAWRSLLEKHCERYISIDAAHPLKENIDALTDIHHLGIADSSFDTVFCSQVLEHVPEPGQAIAEFYRILKPKGTLILSVPHLSHMHNEPHDYYRYTKHGLKYLLERGGFEIVLLLPAGGILSFLGMIPSTVTANLFYGVPIFGSIALCGCRIWSKAIVLLDTHLEKRKIYALNYVAVAYKG